MSEKRTEILDDRKADRDSEETVKLEKSDVEEVVGGVGRGPIVTPEI